MAQLFGCLSNVSNIKFTVVSDGWLIELSKNVGAFLWDIPSACAAVRELNTDLEDTFNPVASSLATKLSWLSLELFVTN